MALFDMEMLELLLIAVIMYAILFPSLFSFRKGLWPSKSWKHKNARPLPPGPRPWPVIGNLPSLGAKPHESLSNLAKTFGPLMYLRLGSVPTVIVSSAEMAEAVLKTHDITFASRPHLTCGELLGYGSQIFGLLPYGDQWRSSRKLFTTKLVTPSRVEATKMARREEILFMLQSTVQQSAAGKGDRTTGVPMFKQFFNLATNIITRLMFNKRTFGSSDFEGTAFQETVVEVFRLFGAFNIGDFIPSLKPFDLQGYEKQMRAVSQKMDKILQGILAASSEDLHNQNEAEDFLSCLLTQPTELTGKPLSGDEIKAMLVDVLLAGTDTTAITLEWALSELLKNPTALRKCTEELDAVVGHARLVDESDLPALPFLQAVVKETFRLHPAGALMLPHESTEDSMVGKYFIPARSRVVVNVWAIGRDPAVWERALEFRPERFLPGQVDSRVDVLGRNFKLLPFGSGRRSCPGRILAHGVVQHTLAVLLHSCDWTLPSELEDLDMADKFALGVCKAVELQAIATPRLAASVIHLSALP